MTCKSSCRSRHQQLGSHLLEVLEKQPRLLLPRVHALAKQVDAHVVEDPRLDPRDHHDLSHLVDLPAEEVRTHGLHYEELDLLGTHPAVLRDLVESEPALLLRLPEGQLHERQRAHLGPQRRGLCGLQLRRRVDLRAVLGEGGVVHVELALPEGLEQVLDPGILRTVEACEELLLQQLAKVEFLLGNQRGDADLEGELGAILLWDGGQGRESQIQNGALVEVVPSADVLPQECVGLLELRLDQRVDLVGVADLLAQGVEQLLRGVGLALERQLLRLQRLPQVLGVAVGRDGRLEGPDQV
mmetsp:Transcript_2584/g.7949  ORF Transcript_2584/g.7949 Transcript_2584/m.7949 type:complete len:299 (+) Transcript_2584:85-981(+)